MLSISDQRKLIAIKKTNEEDMKVNWHTTLTTDVIQWLIENLQREHQERKIIENEMTRLKENVKLMNAHITELKNIIQE